MMDVCTVLRADTARRAEMLRLRLRLPRPARMRGRRGEGFSYSSAAAAVGAGGGGSWTLHGSIENSAVLASIYYKIIKSKSKSVRKEPSSLPAPAGGESLSRQAQPKS